MKKRRRIYIVRHGETIYNVENRVQGWSDSSLTDKGIGQASEIGLKLSKIPFGMVYTSELGRHQETARLIMRKNVCGSIAKGKIDNRLKEINYGSLEEQKNEEVLKEIARIRKTEFQTFETLIKDISISELTEYVAKADRKKKAETSESALLRFTKALEDIFKNMEEKKVSNVLAVSSGGIMGLLLEKIKKGDALPSFVENGDIMVLICEQGKIQIEAFYNGKDWVI